MHRKGCARMWPDFSIILICPAKNSNEKILDIFIYKNKIKTNLVFTFSHSRPGTICPRRYMAEVLALRRKTLCIIINQSIRPMTIFFLEMNWITCQLLSYIMESNLWVKQNVLTYLTKLFLDFILDYIESMSKIILVLHWSNKTNLFYHWCMFG